MNCFKRKKKKENTVIKLKYIKSRIDNKRLDKEYNKFKKHWVEYYKEKVKGEKEAEEMHKKNIEYDMINDYCYIMYQKEFKVEYNDKKSNMLLVKNKKIP